MTREPPDMSRPNPARVHDALLGGSSNYADRAEGGRLLEICPQLRDADKASVARPTGLPSRAHWPPTGP
jgi:hypothetical protein